MENTTAKFYCQKTSSIVDLNYFILNGSITEGEIKIGQYINFVTSKAILKLRVIGIQLINYRINRKEKLDIAIECQNKEALELLNAVKISNRMGFITNH